jgi:acyl-CoA synthetase (AMP-forming)/AMP-acid ligase II
MVMQGYWNRPEETGAALRDGWMHTGDAGFMDEDGYVTVVDRLKDMIITGGENVYSVEVENVLAAMPEVLMCAVIAVPDPDWGERVHAVVMPREAARLTQDEVIAFCRRHLAGYKCPRSVEIRDSMPLSAAGKLLKHELRREHWQGRARNIG